MIGLALSAANPGLLALRSGSGSRSYASDYARDRRLREDEERRRAERRARWDERAPEDLRGLDPEEDRRLIRRIIENRPLEVQLKIAQDDLRRAQQDPAALIQTLDPEEDYWLIRRIREDGTDPYERKIAWIEAKIAEAKLAAWVQAQIDSTEG